MNRFDKITLFDGIDDKYIEDAMPRRQLAYGATRNERIYDDRRLPLMFIETVMSVAAVVLVLGGIFIWTLVGKDLLKAGNSDDNESVTSVQENGEESTSAYSKGLMFELDEENNGYIVVGIGKCKDRIIKIPPTYKGLPVTEIGMNAFSSCKDIIEVEIPNTVKIIGKEAFFHCSSLKKVTIPDSVTEIHDYAFACCGNLTEMKIPEGVTSICGLLEGCYSIEKVELPSTLKLLGEFSFSCCVSLETIVIPEGVTEIGTKAFLSCWSIKKITIPGSVLSIGQSAFQTCINLRELTLNEGLEKISNSAFENSDIRSFVIPSSVREIEDFAFRNCQKLTDITIPEGVTTLGLDIFSSCNNLKNAVINAKVESLHRLFYGCEKLESITLGEGIEVLDDVICELNSLKRVFLPSTIWFINRYNFYYSYKLDNLEITYNGTIEQWQAVEREYIIFLGKPITVHCINGDCIDGPAQIKN